MSYMKKEMYASKNQTKLNPALDLDSFTQLHLA